MTVKFGLKGMGVAPGFVDWPNTGHHYPKRSVRYEQDKKARERTSFRLDAVNRPGFATTERSIMTKGPSSAAPPIPERAVFGSRYLS